MKLKVEFISDDPVEGKVIKTSTANAPDGYEYESSGNFEGPFQVHVRKDYPDRADIKKVTIEDAPEGGYHRWKFTIDSVVVTNPGPYK